MKRTTTTVIVSILALAGGASGWCPDRHKPAPAASSTAVPLHVRTAGAWLDGGHVAHRFQDPRAAAFAVAPGDRRGPVRRRGGVGKDCFQPR